MRTFSLNNTIKIFRFSGAIRTSSPLLMRKIVQTEKQKTVFRPTAFILLVLKYNMTRNNNPLTKFLDNTRQ